MRNSDIALFEIRQEFESQRLQLQQANQWADHAQRDEEIEELRRICCEETDIEQDKRELMNCLCIKERTPATVCQLTQIQDSQNKINSLSDAREFDNPETASSCGETHVPNQPFTVPSPRTIPCRDSGLPHDTPNIVGTSGNVF